MTDTDNTLSRTRRRNAHADIDRASPEDIASVAHNLVDDLIDIIDAIARHAADQTRHYISRPRPSTSPPPSAETEAELLQERQVVAIEAIAKSMSKISSSFYTDFDGSALNVWVYKGEKQ
jgi:hypothetical protein